MQIIPKNEFFTFSFLFPSSCQIPSCMHVSLALVAANHHNPKSSHTSCTASPIERSLLPQTPDQLNSWITKYH